MRATGRTPSAPSCVLHEPAAKTNYVVSDYLLRAWALSEYVQYSSNSSVAGTKFVQRHGAERCRMPMFPCARFGLFRAGLLPQLLGRRHSGRASHHCAVPISQRACYFALAHRRVIPARRRPGFSVIFRPTSLRRAQILLGDARKLLSVDSQSQAFCMAADSQESLSATGGIIVRMLVQRLYCCPSGQCCPMDREPEDSSIRQNVSTQSPTCGRGAMASHVP